jgi:hypothetical protein
MKKIGKKQAKAFFKDEIKKNRIKKKDQAKIAIILARTLGQ